MKSSKTNNNKIMCTKPMKVQLCDNTDISGVTNIRDLHKRPLHTFCETLTIHKSRINYPVFFSQTFLMRGHDSLKHCLNFVANNRKLTVPSTGGLMSNLHLTA